LNPKNDFLRSAGFESAVANSLIFYLAKKVNELFYFLEEERFFFHLSWKNGRALLFNPKKDSLTIFEFVITRSSGGKRFSLREYPV